MMGLATPYSPSEAAWNHMVGLGGQSALAACKFAEFAFSRTAALSGGKQVQNSFRKDQSCVVYDIHGSVRYS